MKTIRWLVLIALLLWPWPSGVTHAQGSPANLYLPLVMKPAVPPSWVHNPPLPPVADLRHPGEIQLVYQRTFDQGGKATLTIGTDQYAVIKGANGDIPPIGKVGGQYPENGLLNGCYVVLVTAPYTWDQSNQLSFGWASGIYLYDIDPKVTDPLVWTAIEVARMQIRNSDPVQNPCIRGVDVWVYYTPQ